MSDTPSEPISSFDTGDTAHMDARFETMPVLPLRNVVFFPGQIMPLFVGRPSSIRLIEDAYRAQSSVIVLTQRDSSIDLPHIDDLYTIGTVVRVVKIYPMPDGSKSVVVQGVHKARYVSLVSEEPYLNAHVERVEDPLAVPAESDELAAMVQNIRTLFKRLSDLVQDFNPEQLSLIMNTEDVATFGYLVSSIANLPVPEKQALLETLSVRERLNQVTIALAGNIQRLELSQKIQNDVQDTINKTQREYFLREQLRAIKKELGEDQDRLEVDELKKKLEETVMPEDVKGVWKRNSADCR